MAIDEAARAALISRVTRLLAANELKQQDYQRVHNEPAIGCLTREACVVVSLLPQMQSLGVTLDDCH